MTDMTPEQALSDALDNLVHDNYERSYRGSQERQADADLIRAALSRPAVPEGYKLVPMEPTDEICEALEECLRDHGFDHDGIGELSKAACWDAMLAAAPEPASEPEDGPVAVIRLIPGSSPRSDLESHPVIALHRPNARNAREVSLQQDDDTNVVQWHVQSPDGFWRPVGHRFSLPSEVAIRTRLWHENQRLRERVKEMEADAKRLDWLEDAARCYYVRVLSQPSGLAIFDDQGPGLRAAITAAMQESES